MYENYKSNLFLVSDCVFLFGLFACFPLHHSAGFVSPLQIPSPRSCHTKRLTHESSPLHHPLCLTHSCFSNARWPADLSAALLWPFPTQGTSSLSGSTGRGSSGTTLPRAPRPPSWSSVPGPPPSASASSPQATTPSSSSADLSLTIYVIHIPMGRRCLRGVRGAAMFSPSRLHRRHLGRQHSCAKSSTDIAALRSPHLFLSHPFPPHASSMHICMRLGALPSLSGTHRPPGGAAARVAMALFTI